MIRFTVYGEPCAKGRPRFTKFGKTYTPDKTLRYEDQVRYSYLQTEREKYFDKQQLRMTVKAYFSIPDSKSKRIKEKMLSGEIRPTKKPDFDNVAKIISDSLNGIAYKDDSQIVKGEVEKFYAIEPKVEVEINEYVTFFI